MELNKFIQRKFKGTGLVEVIVVIAILSIAMVSVVGVTTRGMKQIKRDEIKDQAAGLQLQSIELAKSPAALTFPGDLRPGDFRNYTLDFQSENGAALKNTNSTIDLSADNCSDRSVYYVDYDEYEPGSSGNVFCNQIRVSVEANTAEAGITKNFYIIKSIVVYKTADGFEKKELSAFRSE